MSRYYNRVDDGTRHLRAILGRGNTKRTSWDVRGADGEMYAEMYAGSFSVCERRVWTVDTVATMSRSRITCPACAVFADAWIEAGMRGSLAIARVRRFKAAHGLVRFSDDADPTVCGRAAGQTHRGCTDPNWTVERVWRFLYGIDVAPSRYPEEFERFRVAYAEAIGAEERIA